MTMLEERVSSMEGAYDHLATKADAQELRGEMQATAEELRSEMRTTAAEIRGEMRATAEELRSEMRTTAAEIRGEMNAATERLQGQIEASKQELRAEIISQVRASEIRLIKWGAGMMIGVALGMLASIAAMLRLIA